MAKNKSIAVKRPASARNDLVHTFSRKHDSSQPMEDARNSYLFRSGPECRRIAARALALSRSHRTAQEQIEELDRRLGLGVGAARERSRLWDQIRTDRNERMDAKFAARMASVGITRPEPTRPETQEKKAARRRAARLAKKSQAS